MASPALATHVEPTPIAGNASCGELGDYTFEFKIDESPETKTYSDPNSDFEVDITLNGDGSIDFSSNLPVDAVFIKGGNEGGNLYVYDPPVTEDEGLDTPTGQGISHVSFCFNEQPEESEAPSVPASVEGSVAASVSASVPASAEGSVAGGTGTPAASLANTALSLTGSGSLATIFFGAVLIASLGALAYANVTAVRRRR